MGHMGHIIWNLNLMKTLFESLIRELEQQQHDTILMNQYSTAWQSKNFSFLLFGAFLLKFYMRKHSCNSEDQKSTYDPIFSYPKFGEYAS